MGAETDPDVAWLLARAHEDVEETDVYGRPNHAMRLRAIADRLAQADAVVEACRGLMPRCGIEGCVGLVTLTDNDDPPSTTFYCEKHLNEGRQNSGVYSLSDAEPNVLAAATALAAYDAARAKEDK